MSARHCALYRLAVGVAGVVLLLQAGAVHAEYEYDPGDFATVVADYVAGTGVPLDPITADPFDDPGAALGRPTVDTTGDGWDIPLPDSVPVVPVYSAFRFFEIVTVGLDGHLVLMFDHPVVDDPRNPYGIDLLVFGNAAHTIAGGGPWTNGDPNDTTVTPSAPVEPAVISVSQDGQAWYAFTDGPCADDFAPTLGRVYDPQDPDPDLGEWNQWWGRPTDPTIPLDPRLAWPDLGGQTVAQVAQTYEDSAGGTGFDLAWLEQPGLDWIQYVRVEPTPGGGTPEVDAVSDVFAHLGDFDRDGDLDLADFARFQACFTGPSGNRTPRDCFPADFDGNLVTGDTDVDLDDYGQFAQGFTGPGGSQ